MNRNLTKIIFIASLVLLFGQAANQIFCGDIDCLQGGSTENCATLLCSILGSHTPTSGSDQEQDQGQDNDCHCVCHLQFNRTNLDLVSLALAPSGQVNIEQLILRNSTVNRIYHPPAA